MSAYRLYRPAECGDDGYPRPWHERLKHDVRDDAGNRCIRCGHPYRNGEHGRGEWSLCDERCTHAGPYRTRRDGEDWCLTDSTAPEVGRLLAYDRSHTTVNPANPNEAIYPGSLLVEARWRILTVHHLDGVKANCRWWNLAALCQRCHLTIQGRVQMARVWPWEHSEWFRPYVAGYYAWTYLGQDLTRPEAEARQDELLALERAA